MVGSYTGTDQRGCVCSRSNQENKGRQGGAGISRQSSFDRKSSGTHKACCGLERADIDIYRYTPIGFTSGGPPIPTGPKCTATYISFSKNR